jgi:uncharacterized protein YjiK
MAVTATPIFPQLIKSPAVQILPADTTTLKTLVTAGADGTIVNELLISSTDTSARDLAVYVTISAVDYLIGTVSIPANAGNSNSIPSVGFFDSANLTFLQTDNNGHKFLMLETGAVLKVKTLTTVTAAKAIQVVAQAGNF